MVAFIMLAIMVTWVLPVGATTVPELEDDIYWRMSECPVIQSLTLDEPLGQFGEVLGFSFNWSLIIYSGSPNITPVESPTGSVALSITDRPRNYYTFDARFADIGVVSGEFTLTASGRVSESTQVFFSQSSSSWQWLTVPVDTFDDGTFEISYQFTLPLAEGQNGIRLSFIDEVDFILDEFVLEGVGTTVPVQLPMFAPENVVVDRETGRISWDEVEGAERYWIYVNGEHFGWLTGQYLYLYWIMHVAIPYIERDEAFYFQVQAARLGLVYENWYYGSPRSRALEIAVDSLDAPVIRLYVCDCCLIWDVSDEHFLNIYIDGEVVAANFSADEDFFCTLTIFEHLGLEPGIYTFQVRAVSLSTLEFSCLSNEVEVEFFG